MPCAICASFGMPVIPEGHSLDADCIVPRLLQERRNQREYVSGSSEAAPVLNPSQFRVPQSGITWRDVDPNVPYDGVRPVDIKWYTNRGSVTARYRYAMSWHEINRVLNADRPADAVRVVIDIAL